MAAFPALFASAEEESDPANSAATTYKSASDVGRSLCHALSSSSSAAAAADREDCEEKTVTQRVEQRYLGVRMHAEE